MALHVLPSSDIKGKKVVESGLRENGVRVEAILRGGKIITCAPLRRPSSAACRARVPWPPCLLSLATRHSLVMSFFCRAPLPRSNPAPTDIIQVHDTLYVSGELINVEFAGEEHTLKVVSAEDEERIMADSEDLTADGALFEISKASPFTKLLQARRSRPPLRSAS